MNKFKVGDKVTWRGIPEYSTGEVLSEGFKEYRGVRYQVRFDGFEDYDDSEEFDYHTPFENDLEPVVTREENNPGDAVNPDHYSGDLVMRVIEERGLDFALGNAVKYLCRAGSKPWSSRKQDLLKAQWYLNRAIEKEESSTE